MKKSVIVLALVASLSSPAQAIIEESYNPGEPLATTPWYGRADAASRDADLRFISGMRPHHAGALSMSKEYLADPAAKNAQLKTLARAIIHNQTFEIGMLDTVQKHLAAARNTDGLQRIATDNLVQKEQFVRYPAPGFLDALAEPREVSKRDVQFAKAMIVHHQAALDMSNDYLGDAAAKNGYLRLMCLDILVDQAQEIALMESIIGRYAGNPDDVKITADMVHGMEGMNHGKHAAHKHVSHKPEKAAQKAQHDAHHGHH